MFARKQVGAFCAGAQVPFYIRKSVSAGPFRFNFSKSGVGVSVGVKGLRIGTGPRGHYIHAGRGGLYYRATLNNAGRRQSVVPPQLQTPPVVPFNNDDVAMIEIDSGDVMQMRDASFSELLDEMNAKVQQPRMSVILPLGALAIGALAAFAAGGAGLLVGVAALPAIAIGKWLDSYRRTSVLYYDLEGDAEVAYRRLTEGFDGLNGCAAKWHIEAGGAVQSLTAWKRNAGASHLVDRKPTALTYALPAVVKSNITPPALHVGKQVMFFMPDIVLVEDGSRIGAVSYTDLNVRWQDSSFIETERIPSDARVVDHTWKHPNKSGGPDRRFRDNRQIPVCLYETMHLTSNSGVNELLEFSRTGVVAAFVDGCRMLAALPRARNPAKALPPTTTNYVVDVDPASTTGRKGSLVRGALLTILGFMVGIPVLTIFFAPEDKQADSQLPSSLAVETSKPPAKPVERGTIKDGKAPRATIRLTKTNANLRQGPGIKFPVIAVVPKGGQLSVLETQGEWSRVQIDANISGWMANSTMKEP